MNYLRTIQNLPKKAWFSYLTIVLLQLKLVWRMWDYKDLTSGDTSAYFMDAYSWFSKGLINVVWSPLYTAFYGSLFNFTQDVYLVTIIHRLIIIFASTIMILALMRQLLPKELAWLIAAWWTILPINFNTLYEVHLFSVIPVLLASLLIIYKQNSWTRGSAIAILFASSFLVRNELFIATLLLSVICLFWELWEIKNILKNDKQTSYYIYLINYGLPLLIAASVILFFYTHSYVKFPEIFAVSKPKHTLNICQVYAFGYQQRHSEWTKSPWTECYSLMEQTFGMPLPSLLEAVRANPQAMIEHFLWNISLALNGIQVSLFNATSGNINPDYVPVKLNASFVAIPTMVCGLILITGIFLIFKERQYWWKYWLEKRALGWLLLMSTAAVAFFVVIPTQRPRPSYLFSLTILLMAAIGMSIVVIARHCPQLNRLSILMIPAILILLTLTPNYYVPSERRLLDFYQRFMPFQNIMAQSDTLFLAREFPNELCSYIRKSAICQPLFYSNIFDKLPLNKPLEILLDEKKVKLFYIDEPLLAQLELDPLAKPFLNKTNSLGWKLIAMQDGGNSKWMLFQKL